MSYIRLCTSEALKASSSNEVQSGLNIFKLIEKCKIEDDILGDHLPSIDTFIQHAAKELHLELTYTDVIQAVRDYKHSNFRFTDDIFNIFPEVPVTLITDRTRCVLCDRKLVIYKSTLPTIGKIYDHYKGTSTALIYSKRCSDNNCRTKHKYSYYESKDEDGVFVDKYYDDWCDKEFFMLSRQTVFTVKRLRHFKATHYIMQSSYKGNYL